MLLGGAPPLGPAHSAQFFPVALGPVRDPSPTLWKWTNIQAANKPRSGLLTVLVQQNHWLVLHLQATSQAVFSEAIACTLGLEWGFLVHVVTSSFCSPSQLSPCFTQRAVSPPSSSSLSVFTYLPLSASPQQDWWRPSNLHHWLLLPLSSSVLRKSLPFSYLHHRSQPFVWAGNWLQFHDSISTPALSFQPRFVAIWGCYLVGVSLSILYPARSALSFTLMLVDRCNLCPRESVCVSAFQ